MVEEKHLAGRHDQKKHARAQTADLVTQRPVKLGVYSAIQTDEISRKLDDFEDAAGREASTYEHMLVTLDYALKNPEFARKLDLTEFDQEIRTAAAEEVNRVDEEGRRLYPEEDAQNRQKSFLRAYASLRRQVARVASGSEAKDIGAVDIYRGDPYLEGDQTLDERFGSPGKWTDDKKAALLQLLGADKDIISEIAKRFGNTSSEPPFSTDMPGGVSGEFSEFYARANPLYGLDRILSAKSFELSDLAPYSGNEPFEEWRDRTVQIAGKAGVPRSVLSGFIESQYVRRKSMADDISRDDLPDEFFIAQAEIVDNAKEFVKTAYSSKNQIYLPVTKTGVGLSNRLDALDRFKSMIVVGNVEDAARTAASMTYQDQMILALALSDRLTNRSEFSIVPGMVREFDAMYAESIPEIDQISRSRLLEAYSLWTDETRGK